MSVQNWKPTTLGENVDLLTGFPFQSARYTEEGDDIRLLRGDNIVQGKFRWEGVKRWPVSDINVNPIYQLEAGDIVLAMDRPWIEAGLKQACISEYDLPCLLVQRVARLRALESLDQRFLRYIIASPAFTKHVLSVQTGTGVPHISGGQIKEFKFTLPPLHIQQRIADVLGSLDDKIECNRRINQTLEAMAQALYKHWFVDFGPFRDGEFEDSEQGQIPKGWKVGSIYEVCDVRYGAPFSSSLFNNEKKGMPLIRIRDLATYQPAIYTTESLPNQTCIAPGDIVVGMDGEFCARHWLGQVSLLNQRVCTFQPKPNVPTVFLSQALREPLGFFERSKTGTTVIHLGKADIDKIRIVLPPSEILKDFAQNTDSLLALIVANAQESYTLAKTRDYLLPKLLSGEVEIHAAEEAVKAVV